MSVKRQRQGLRMCVKNEMGKVKPMITGVEEINSEQLGTSVSKLSTYAKKLEDLDSQVLAEIKLDDEIDEEIAKTCEFNDALLETIARAEVKLKQAHRESANSTRSVLDDSISTRKVAVRLPKLEIAHFAGDELQWQSFWDSFKTTIHSNETLSTVDKFNYLRGLLTGDALRLIEGYRVTEDNYEAVIETLKDRFGNKQLAVFAHFEAMLAVPTANHDISKLQATSDACERHIRSLIALGLDEDTFGQVFTPIMLSKLPKFVKIELHRRNGSQIWSLSHLREWLKDEIRARDMSERTFASSSSDKGQKDEERFKPKPTSNHKNHGRSWEPARTSASALVSSTAARQMMCAFCGFRNHWSADCKKYPDFPSRWALMRDKCALCLEPGHSTKSCTLARNPCPHCKKPGHHVSLCRQKFDPTLNTNRAKPPIPQRQNSNTGTSLNADATPFQPGSASTAVAVSQGARTIMQTAITTLVGTDRKHQAQARMLFDTGGSRSFITEQKRKELQLPIVDEELVSIASFQSTKRKYSRYKTVEFIVICLDGSFQRVRASVVPNITCPIQKIPIDPLKYPIVNQIRLADTIVTQPEFVAIDVLIGNDFYYNFVNTDRIQCPDGPLFLSSRVGFIATGRIETDAQGAETIAVMLLDTGQHGQSIDANFQLEKFWSLEDIGVKPALFQSDDEEAMSKFNSTVMFSEGRYQVRWPWKEQNPDLPHNYYPALGQFKSMMRRLSSNPDVFKAYKDILREQEELGIIERVPEQPTENVLYYMPHHCLVKPSKATTKVRIVYNASSKSGKSSQSLNDCLHRGPLMLEDLCGLLLRFRLNAVALVSDIEKAFLQVGLQPTDRDVTRFFWVIDPSKPPIGSNLIIFRFCRVPFGVISSPFLLLAVISCHLLKFASDTARKIRENVYMDNVITGEDDVKAAKGHYAEAKRLFKSASMNLREWYSNSADVQQTFAPEDHGKDEEPKVLGLIWNTRRDTIRCGAIKPPASTKVTKRVILQAVAQLFDPCGLFSPITVQGKMLIQSLWKQKFDWDDPLPDELVRSWTKIRSDFESISVTEIVRYTGKANGYELHVFCDASANAYAAAVYLRKKSKGSFSADLMFSKTRLSPLKQQLTIPRLELMAACLGVRLLKFVQAQLQLPVDNLVLWSDSQCVLHWINRVQPSTRFVENRLKEIRMNKDIEFRYVPTDHNPADLPSRGCGHDVLTASSMWWKGPSWLSAPQESWPAKIVGIPQETLALELAISEDTVQAMEYVFDISKMSSLLKVLRVTAYLLRFVRNVRSKPPNRLSGPLTVLELGRARTHWEKMVQKEAFPELMKQKMGKHPKGIGQQLNVFNDVNGVLRCAGRLDKSQLSYNAKNPILLPKNRHFTDLIIKDCHEKLLHSGPAQTLCFTRQRYWIIHGRSQVKKLFKWCQRCKRIDGGPYKVPDQPPLPEFRVSESRPFYATGIDYLGPLLVKVSTGVKKKVWICLFTCAATRAIHLEVVDDLTTEEFLLALRRFVAIFGSPGLLVSDNASQFHAAERTIRKLWNEITNSQAVQDCSTKQGIQWKYITELAPWMGGFYERMIGVVKKALKKTLDGICARPVELRTIVCEISAVVNTRPLTYVEDEVGMLPLAPANFLARGGRDGIPDMDHTSDEYIEHPTTADALVLKWKRLEKIMKNFWNMWRQAYLQSLREHATRMSQRNTSQTRPQVGSVVQIKDELPRGRWKLGKIVQLSQSQDGQVRSAVLQVSNGRQIRRAIKHLYPLEIGNLPDNDPNPGKSRPRHQRAAAVRARALWQPVVDDEYDME